jgi:hypothetical protein
MNMAVPQAVLTSGANMWLGISLVAFLSVSLLFAIPSTKKRRGGKRIPRFQWNAPSCVIIYCAICAIGYCIRHPQERYRSSIVYMACNYVMVLARAVWGVDDDS